MSVTSKGRIKGKIYLKAILLLLVLLGAPGIYAIDGYKITLKSNLKNRKVYLGYVYGDTRYPLDTSMTNAEGVAVFEKDLKLTGGIFLLYLTPRKALEFLLTEENRFTVNVDTSDVSAKTTFEGSRENTLYYDFLRKINVNKFHEEELRNKTKHRKLSADSTQLVAAMLQSYRDQDVKMKKQFIEKNKGTFIADLVASQLQPDYKRKGGTLAERERKDRFFEHVNFSNEKLAFSPVLFNLYTEYVNNYVYKSGDSLIVACDTILKKAAAGKENFKWSLYFLSSSFERSSVPGQDKVFVHLVEEYYKKGKCWWLSKEQLDNMIRRSDMLKNLFVGSICPDFIAQDSSGKEMSLHSKLKGTSVLYFWSYDCKHCLEETPKLAEWAKKHPKINLITACAGPDEDKWKEKLREFKLPGTNFGDPELKANYTYLYSISSTPSIFVISKDKKILAKYIDDTQGLEEFLKRKK